MSVRLCRILCTWLFLPALLLGLTPSGGAQTGGQERVGPAAPGVPNPHGEGGVPTSLVRGERPPSDASSDSAPVPQADPHGVDETARPVEPGDGRLTGRLHRKTPGPERLEDLEIRLFAFENQKRVGSWTERSDREGRFQFNRMNTRPTLKYIVSTLYQGVVYLSAGTSFEAGSLEIAGDVDIYDSAPAPGGLKLDKLDIFLQPDPSGSTSVTEVITFNNPGDHTLVGEAEGTQTLQIDLPRGARDFQVVQGMPPNLVSALETGVAYSGPIYPGSNQWVFGYMMGPEPGWVFRRRLPWETASVAVYVPTNGPQVLSPQLSLLETKSLEGMEYRHYTGGPFSAGSGLSFQIGAAGPVSSSGKGSIPVWPVTGVVVLGVVVWVCRPVFRQRSLKAQMPSSATSELRILALERDRRRALAAVQELDFDFESGKLSPEDYHRLRVDSKAAAIQAMKAIDTLQSGIIREVGSSNGERSDMSARQGALAGASEAHSGSAAPPFDGGDAAGRSVARHAGGQHNSDSLSPDSLSGGMPPEMTPGGPPSTGMPSGSVLPGTNPSGLVVTRFCTSCGVPFEPGDRFCGACGSRLRVAG